MPTPFRYRLDDLNDLRRAIDDHPRSALVGQDGIGWDSPMREGGMYCPHCRVENRMDLFLRDGVLVPVPKTPPARPQIPPGLAAVNLKQTEQIRLHQHDGMVKVYERQMADRYVPMLLTAVCVTCRHRTTLVLYPSSQGPALAILPASGHGQVTANTPAAVAYYLQEAGRSHALGANSAAVAMYRAALENLLFDQGFVRGMLAQKLAELELAIQKGEAPSWIQRVDSEYLEIIKRLGNLAIHPNDGDISKQSLLDANLVRVLQVVFSELLDAVYEAPMRDQMRKSALRAAISPIPGLVEGTAGGEK